MEILEIVFGWFLLDLLGGVLRYLFVNLYRKLKGKELVPFKNFSTTSKKKEMDRIDNDTSNRLTGGLFILIIILIIIYNI